MVRYTLFIHNLSAPHYFVAGLSSTNFAASAAAVDAQSFSSSSSTTSADPLEDGIAADFLSDDALAKLIAEDAAREVGPEPLVAAGSTVKTGYGYVVSIDLQGMHSCGGSLIDNRAVLTAAHCLYNSRQNTFYPLAAITVHVGDTNRYTASTRRVRGMLRPDTFRPSRGFYGDVALLLLDSAVSERPAEMTTNKKKDYGGYKALGWGRTEDAFLSPVLMQTNLDGISQSKCSSLSRQNGMGAVPRDHICAGLNKNGADTCAGDSGGPLLVGGQLVGLTSYGPAAAVCGQANGKNFGVYTSVGYWHTWIQDSMSVFNLRGTTVPLKFNKPQFGMCYLGNTFKTIKTSSVGKCCDSCRSNSGCWAWSWSLRTNTCAFKHKNVRFTKRASKNCHAGTFS